MLHTLEGETTNALKHMITPLPKPQYADPTTWHAIRADSRLRSILNELRDQPDQRLPHLRRAWLTIGSNPALWLALLNKYAMSPVPAIKVSASYFVAGYNLRTLTARVDEASRTHAIAVLHSALEQTSSASFLLALDLLAYGPVPTELIPRLRRLLRSESFPGTSLAATALAGVGVGYRKVIEALSLGMGTQFSALGQLAAERLAKLAERSGSARDLLRKQLLSDRPATRFDAFRGVLSLGSAAFRYQREALTILSSDQDAPGPRALALEVLATIGKRDSGIDAAISDALRNNSLLVVESAARACQALNWSPTSAASILLQRLEAAAATDRPAVYRAIAAVGSLCRQDLDMLLARIDVEDSDDTRWALAQAIARAGAACVPPLVNRLRRAHDLRVMSFVSMAFVNLDRDGARSLADEVREEEDPWVLMALSFLAREMHRHASELVPVFSELLEEAECESDADVLLTVISSAGPVGVMGLGGLLRCLMLGSRTLAERATLVLVRLGPSIVPSLESNLPLVDGEVRHRIVEVIAKLQTDIPSQFADLAGIRNDRALETIVLVASTAKEDGKVSIKRAAAELKRRRDNGLLAEDQPVSESALRNAINEIEKHLPWKLIDRKDGRSGELASEAIAFISRVRDYLEFKRRASR